jgi:hypothetical protein
MPLEGVENLRGVQARTGKPGGRRERVKEL